MIYAFLIPFFFSILQLFYIFLFYRMERRYLKRLEGETFRFSKIYFNLFVTGLLNSILPIAMLVPFSFFINIDDPILTGILLFTLSLFYFVLLNYLQINREYVGFYVDQQQFYVIKYDFRLSLVDFMTIPLDNIKACNFIYLNTSRRGFFLEFSLDDKKEYFGFTHYSERKLKKMLKSKNISFQDKNMSVSEYKSLQDKIQTRFR